MPLIEEMADVSDGPSGAPPDPDENYAAFTERRLEKEWEEQLEMARAANVGVDEHDVDVRDLYGEQSVHIYPDVHADWGDARHRRPRRPRRRRVPERRGVRLEHRVSRATRARHGRRPRLQGGHEEPQDDPTP